MMNQDSKASSSTPAERREMIDTLAGVLAGEAFCADWHGDPEIGVREIQRIRELFVVYLNKFADAILSSDLVGMDQKKLTAQSDHQTEHLAHVLSLGSEIAK